MENLDELIIANIAYFLSFQYYGIRDLPAFKTVNKRFWRIVGGCTCKLQPNQIMYIASVKGDIDLIAWMQRRGVNEYGEQVAGAIASCDFDRADTLIEKVQVGEWYPILYVSAAMKNYEYARIALNNNALVTMPVLKMLKRIKDDKFRDLYDAAQIIRSNQRLKYRKEQHFREWMRTLRPDLTDSQINFYLSKYMSTPQQI